MLTLLLDSELKCVVIAIKLSLMAIKSWGKKKEQRPAIVSEHLCGRFFFIGYNNFDPSVSGWAL